MAKPFKNLKQKMSPASLARAEKRAKRALEEMPLNELRAARQLTQESLAKSLGINQAAVSKMERALICISTLRQFVVAMGGELEITLAFRMVLSESTSSRMLNAFNRPARHEP